MKLRGEAGFLFGVLFYAIICTSVILFASPLFRALGFEYSAIASMLISIQLLYYVSKKASSSPNQSLKNLASVHGFEILILIHTPLLVSVVSLLWIPNCSLVDGLIFYAELVYPTAILSILIALTFFSVPPKNVLRRNLSIACFWILTLIISILPGYFSPKIYTYGWQYGFFPGFVWDEAMELGSPYWMSRIYEILFFSSLLTLRPFKFKKLFRRYSRTVARAHGFKFFATSAAIYLSGSSYLNQFFSINVNHYLREAKTIHSVHLHTAHNNLTSDELLLVSSSIADDVSEIDSIYHIHSPERIDVYVFPTSDDLYKYVGTKEASISKPWRREIYIAKPNLSSLKHELAHILLADHGSFPFSISWNTALTEGAAVAIEDDFDGIRDCDDVSRSIMQLHPQDGVAEIMQPAGFLSSSSLRCYELSGSFSKYLTQKYGEKKYVQVYTSRDFDNVYQKSISRLESEWKQSLRNKQTVMSSYDSLRTRYYFDRPSVLGQPCLRRIGKLFKLADEYYLDKNYYVADSLYRELVAESGRIAAIRGRVYSQLHLGNPDVALKILDTTTQANTPLNLAALRILRGDVIMMATGDKKRAIAEWDEALKLELSDQYFISAYIRRFALANANSTPAAQKVLYDLYFSEIKKSMFDDIFSLEPEFDHFEPGFYIARLMLYTLALDRKGHVRDAYKIWRDGSKDIQAGFQNRGESVKAEFQDFDKLFDSLAQRKFKPYSKAFDELPAVQIDNHNRIVEDSFYRTHTLFRK